MTIRTTHIDLLTLASIAFFVAYLIAALVA
jgi:hypothetical protein